MKRLFLIFLSLVLLLACVPTPEEEFVVNKGDNVTEQKIQNEQMTDAQFFPDRWDEDPIEVNEYLKLDIRAEIVQKEDGKYPAFRTKPASWTQEEVVALLNRMLPPPVEKTIAMETKDDVRKSYQNWLADLEKTQELIASRGDADYALMSQEEIDGIAKDYQKRIEEAPETLEGESVSDYSALKMNTEAAVYRLSDGTKAFICAYSYPETGEASLSVAFDCDNQAYIYYQYQNERERELGDVKPFLPVTLSREAAEAQLRTELDKLGFSGFAIAAANPADLCQFVGDEAFISLSAGWGFKLQRDYGGYPMSKVPFEPSSMLHYGDGDAFVMNKQIREEFIEVYLDESGIRLFRYENPRTTVAQESENVELLSFDQLKMRIRNAFTATFPIEWATGSGTVYTIRVYRLLFTNFTVRVKDSEDYYEIPCCVVFYDNWGTDEKRLDNPAIMSEALIINAIDGSVIHWDMGI